MVTELGPGREFDLIRRFLEGGARPGPAVRVGPGDDCAVVTGAGVAITSDMSVEDVHFRRCWLEPGEVGYRAAAASLSDLAAVAARPIGVLVSIALGPGDEAGYGDAVMAGVGEAARDSGVALLGGDVTRSPGPIVLDVTAVGDAPEPVLRTGARPGHGVWVTGRLGAAAAAVDAWLADEAPAPEARAAFARPTPRLEEALWLRERSVPAAMVDLSDGIAGDAGHIAAANGVRVVIRADALPVADAAAGRPDPLRLAAAGGEDYELCFTSPAGAVETIRDAFVERFGIELTEVGGVEEGTGAVVVGADGEPLELEAFQHWGRERS
ncbi:MAG: thiamine-phosphate kinase [Longimicrobiales bacterium]|nr:thiamine-phosphate kinase [Longimicrobiales bacterium]